MALQPALTTGQKQATRPLGLRDDSFSDPSSAPTPRRERLVLYHDGYNTVTFRWKDYRAEQRDRFKTMMLDANEFIQARREEREDHGISAVRADEGLRLREGPIAGVPTGALELALHSAGAALKCLPAA
jgi:hypothetical protein